MSDPIDCSPSVSSVHGIFQARILEWVAIPFSRIFPTQGLNPDLLHCRRGRDSEFVFLLANEVIKLRMPGGTSSSTCGPQLLGLSGRCGGSPEGNSFLASGSLFQGELSSLVVGLHLLFHQHFWDLVR